MGLKAIKLPSRVSLVVFVAALRGVVHAEPATQPTQNHPLDLSHFDLKLIYENDLTQPQKISREEDFIERLPDGTWHRKATPDADAKWIAEGNGGCIVRNGKLWVAPTPFDANGQPAAGAPSHMVVFNSKVLPADFLVQFNANPSGSTNGLLIVFFCAAGTHGQDLFDLMLPPRRAVYDAYQHGAISDYSDAYWSRNTIPAGESETNRLRKNPGALLVAQGKSQTTGPTDVTHHLRILKVGSHIQIEVQGKVVTDWTDPGAPLGAGRFGLRSMAGITKVAYSNFKVWQITPGSKRSTP